MKILYYSSFISFYKKYCVRKKGKQVGREKKWIVKVGDFFFCSQLLTELNFHCSAEQKPPF